MKKTERITIRVTHEIAEKLKKKHNPSAFIREAVSDALLADIKQRKE